jgi:hypothetical protein
VFDRRRTRAASGRHAFGSSVVQSRAGSDILCAMSVVEKSLRKSVSLPARVARRVRSLAQTNRVSANRIIVALIESGLAAKEQEKRQFLHLAERLARSRDPREQRRLKDELARMTFGE